MPAMALAADRRQRRERSAQLSRRHDAPFRSLRAQPRAGGADRLVPLPQPVAEELRRIVGRESVIDAPNDLRIFERDGSIEGAVPDAAVLASSTEHVSAVINVAPKHRIPVVPRAAGTAF